MDEEKPWHRRNPIADTTNWDLSSTNRFLTSAKSKTLQSELNRALLDVVPQMPSEKVFYEHKTDWTTLKQLQRLHQYDPFFEELISKGPLRDLAAQLLNQSAIPQNLQYFNNHPGRACPHHLIRMVSTSNSTRARPSPCGWPTILWTKRLVACAMSVGHTDEGCVRTSGREHSGLAKVSPISQAG